MGNDAEGYLVSTRWSAEATHSGGGAYGQPTGQQVQIWGITQQEIRNGLVTREWMLFNELDLMIQIASSD
jgi:predicted ester cyclase